MVRINAIFPEDMLQKLDDIAKDKKKSRSMLLREAIEKLIEEHQRQLEKNRRKTLIKHAIDVQDRLRRKSCKWDGVSEIREWREMVK